MSLLLGAPDRQIQENETTTWETSKIGGLPDWFTKTTPPPCCAVCRREMMLVTQIYCPLTDSPYHRCLHVFVCYTKGCSNQQQGWRVIRTQLLDETQSNTVNRQSTGQDNWGIKQDDWGVEQDDWGVEQDDWGVEQDDWSVDEDNLENACNEEMPDHHKEPCPSVSSVDSAEAALARLTVSNDPSAGDAASQTPANTSQHPQTLPGGGPHSHTLSTEGAGGAGCHHGNTMQASGESSSTTADGDVEGCEVSEGVQVEGVAIDDEGVQRMMGLLAGRVEDDEKSPGERASRVSEAAHRAMFPAYYLEVFAESDVKEELSEHVASLLHDYQEREGKQFAAVLDEHRRGQSKADTENYDRTEVKHGDKECYKFIKRLHVYPQQCIRYQWNGSPLLIAKPSGTLKATRCEHCASPRGFELQLVPPLIPLLKLPGETEPAVEFGTALVFTCINSCWGEEGGWREEVVRLQHDPDHHRFK